MGSNLEQDHLHEGDWDMEDDVFVEDEHDIDHAEQMQHPHYGSSDQERDETLDPELSDDIEAPMIQFMVSFSEDEDDERDTTVDSLNIGKDLQGIPWHETQWNRESYRKKRDEDYRSYFNLDEEVAAAAPAIEAEATKVQTERPKFEGCQSPPSLPIRFFDFYRNWRQPTSSIVHFQLRNLIWASTSHDLYLVHENKVNHWNNLKRHTPDPIMDVSGSVPGAVAPNIGTAQLCTLCVRHGIAAAGGFGGELIVHRIGSTAPEVASNKEKFACSMRISDSENGITNAIEIFRDGTGATKIVCSNNDAAVRIFDVARFVQVQRYNVPWAVNFCAPRPGGGNMLCAVGDDPVAAMFDVRSARQVMSLKGHYDYCFAAAWHPDGNVVATGNQDLTTRLFDIRMPSRSFCLLKAKIGAIRSIRFTSDGRYMAVAEPADYISIYDVAAGYKRAQVIDLFGEISGISFSPDGERLFAGVADVHYSSVLQFNRSKSQGKWTE